MKKIILIIIFLFSTSYAYRVGNIKIPEYSSKMKIPTKMKTIVLRGSWYEMGLTYGKKAGSEISIVYDGYIDECKARNLSILHIKRGVSKYLSQIKYFSPQFIDFIKGIAVGANKELKNSKYNNEMSDLYKIIFINTYFEFMMYDFWMPKGCTTWAISKEWSGTKRICGLNRDLPFWPNIYQVMLVFYPNDKKAYSFSQTVTAGWIGSNGGFNSKGLFVGQTKVSHDKNTCFGYPAIMMNTYLLAYCKNISSALDVIARGNFNYRKKTNNRVLMNSTAMNYLLCDKKNMIVVEKEKFRYAFRKPGYFGELGKYIVCTNHFTCNFSYDKNNKRTNTPMTEFGENKNTSWWEYTNSRFQTAMYIIEKNKHKLNISTVIKKICCQQKYYLRNGKEILKVNDPDSKEKNVKPVDYGFTIDNKFKIGNNWFGGTVSSHIIDIDNMKMYFTIGLPSDWYGKWQSIKLIK